MTTVCSIFGYTSASLEMEGNIFQVGISFFEFQVRYDKGGSEMDFGMCVSQTSGTFTTESIHRTSRAMASNLLVMATQVCNSDVNSDVTWDFYFHHLVDQRTCDIRL